jgi:hypothetical protein
MKKILFVSLLTVSHAFAQDATPVAPAPVDPVVAPQAVAKETVTPIDVRQSGGDTIPTLNRVDPTSFNLKLGAGSAFGPSAFWMVGEAEVQLDKFIAIGPKLQYGTNNNTDFMYGSIGPRFTLPFSYFELGFGTGFGFAYRNVAGFEFTNFLYNAGLNFDVYLFSNLSVGLGYNANMTSTAADSFISALTVSAGGHF